MKISLSKFLAKTILNPHVLQWVSVEESIPPSVLMPGATELNSFAQRSMDFDWSGGWVPTESLREFDDLNLKDLEEEGLWCGRI